MSNSGVGSVEFNREDIINSQSNFKKSELDKDAFLKILVAQMQYQDPMTPMDNSQFIGQMAQFSSLEQMNNMVSGFGQIQSYNLIGKTVYAEVEMDVGGGVKAMRQVAGIVESAGFKEGSAYVVVGGVEVKVSEVKEVFDTNALFLSTESVLNSAAMVGKYVLAEYTDAEGNNVTIGGTVNKLIVKDGNIFLKIGEHEFNMNGIREIGESGEEIYEVVPPQNTGGTEDTEGGEVDTETPETPETPEIPEE